MTHFLSIKDKIFLSIIVPCYNAEKYIHKLIDSVIAQSISDWELILIDDGSKDKTAEICRKAAQNDSRIRYIYQDNAGVSNARNQGLKVAKGEYISYVDADDWIEWNFIEVFQNSHLAEINICGYQEVFPNGKIKTKQFPEKALYSRSPLQTYTVRNSFFRTPWAIVFRHEFLKKNKMKFQENLSWGEDTMFMLNAVRIAKDINFVPDVIYNYRYTGEGLTNSPKRHKNMVQFLNVYMPTCKDVKKESVSSAKMMEELILFLSVILLNEVIKANYDNKEKMEYITNIHLYLKAIPFLFVCKKKVGRIRYLAVVLAKLSISPSSSLTLYNYFI